nr:cytochrome c [Parvularcula dongshanensis]
MLVVFAAGLIVAYTGAYNVAATRDHTAFGRWALGTTMENSIQRRADGIEAPVSFSEAQIASGARRYKAMCAHCHAGPGIERAEWAEGMLPQPPHLTEHGNEWAPEEIFWILNHGIKMSGMPAFGPTHEDEALWEITAFVRALPGMTTEQYKAYGEPAEQGGAGHGH